MGKTYNSNLKPFDIGRKVIIIHMRISHMGVASNGKFPGLLGQFERKDREMKRKILAGILIVLGSILLILSVTGIGLAWVYNEPLTQRSVARLQEVDGVLVQIQKDLQSAKMEVERALRLIESGEEALAALAQQSTGGKQLLDQVGSMLDDELIPGLASTREKIDQLQGALEDLRTVVRQVNSIPFINLNLPGDQELGNVISGADALDTEIANVQDLAERTSTFVSDLSFALGGDFDETKQHLQDLLQILKDNDKMVSGWRSEVRMLIVSMPRWIDNASIILTVFLLWFGVSQFGLILHGLSIRRGDDPLAVLRTQPPA